MKIVETLFNNINERCLKIVGKQTNVVRQYLNKSLTAEI